MNSAASSCALPISSVLITICTGITTGVLNFFLASNGYLAPEFVQATGETIGFVQNAGVQGVITFFFLGLEVITGLLLAGLLFFVDVEKHMGTVHDDLKARHQAKH